MVRYLLHYGTPRHSGRYPWGSGKRPYQSAVKIVNGNPKDANDIYDTLSTKEKHLVGATRTKPYKKYIRDSEEKYLLDSIMLKIGDLPVSSFEIWNQGEGEASVSLLTRNDPEYRGKGYAYELAKRGKEFFDNNPSLQKMSWSAHVDNKASRKLAEKLGFELINEEDEWAYYEMSKNSSSIANSIHDKAKSKEPKITKDVTDAQKLTSGKMYGLENRLKTKDSIARKIDTDSKEKGISLEDAANGLKDAVRYTLVSSDNDFVKNYNIFKNYLQNNNYVETRCKNYFDLYNKGIVKHKSVQSQFTDPSGYSFEVQFQTPSSQKAKDKKIPLYEEARSLGVSNARKAELEKLMVNLAEEVSTPKNISRIKSH